MPGGASPLAARAAPVALRASPVHGGERRASFLCGDDAGAKADVAAVLEVNGFAPIDLGRLREGSPLQQAGGPLASIDLRVVRP